MTPLPALNTPLTFNPANMPFPPTPSLCRNKLYYLQKALLITSFVLSILSLIPSLRIISSLVLRSVATLSSLFTAKTDLETPEPFLIRAVRCTKIAICILGLAGAVTNMPLLLVISVAIDLAIQTFELIKAAADLNARKSLVHMVVITMDILLLLGFLFGSWQLMIAAASIGIVFMLAMAVKIGIDIGQKRRPLIDIFDICCYVGLAGTSLASAVMCSESTRQNRKNNQNYTNGHDHPVKIRYFESGRWNEITLQPGEQISVQSISTPYFISENGIHYYYGPPGFYLFCAESNRWQFITTYPLHLPDYIIPINYHSVYDPGYHYSATPFEITLKSPIPVSALHTLPIGQSISVANETTSTL